MKAKELHKNIMVILPVLGDTKDSKRIKLLNDSGFIVNVAYFDRPQFSPRTPSANSLNRLGEISNGNYFLRIFVFIASIFKIRKLAQKNDLLYCVGADLAILSFFASLGLKKNFVIDVADIRPIQISDSIFGRILRYLEAYVSKKSSLIIITSPSFIEFYYNKILKMNSLDFFLLENKVDFSCDFNFNSNIVNENKIVLGYFGAIRDRWTLILINKIIEKYPQRFEAYIAGINLIDETEFSKFTKNRKGITYFGPFKSPEDLSKLYNKIDVMLTFYPDYDSSHDWFNAKRICRSNRFYEAFVFNKPLLGFSFTDDGKEIGKLNIGLTLENYDLEIAVDKIYKEVSRVNILSWKKNMELVPINVFRLTDEKEKLTLKLIEIINN